MGLVVWLAAATAGVVLLVGRSDHQGRQLTALRASQARALQPADLDTLRTELQQAVQSTTDELAQLRAELAAVQRTHTQTTFVSDSNTTYLTNQIATVQTSLTQLTSKLDFVARQSAATCAAAARANLLYSCGYYP